jgi:hypothetical protein
MPLSPTEFDDQFHPENPQALVLQITLQDFQGEKLPAAEGSFRGDKTCYVMVLPLLIGGVSPRKSASTNGLRIRRIFEVKRGGSALMSR